MDSTTTTVTAASSHDTPRFCKRVSKDEMERTSKEVTRLELQKLQQQHSKMDESPSCQDPTPYKRVSTDKDLHVMLLECMDRLQSLTTHQCELAEKFTNKSKECLDLRSSVTELQQKYDHEVIELRDRIIHLEGICDEYDNDVKTNEKTIREQGTLLIYYRTTHQLLSSSRNRYIALCCLLWITLLWFLYLSITSPEVMPTLYLFLTHLWE